jgi:uncharacterized protein (TIGR02246 family)
MNRWLFSLLAGTSLAGLGIAWAAGRDGQPTKAETANAAQDPQSGSNSSREADRQALHQSARAFVRAFNDRDAKAVAALWTEQAEFVDDRGTVLRGRPAIEKGYAELFKAHPKVRVEVRSDSVHFPSPNTAIGEGLLTVSFPGSDLPVTTAYRAIQVRENGQWQIAFSQEWGADQYKLDDLAWLIGRWTAHLPTREVQLTFAWNEKKTLLRSQFTVKEGSKVVSSGTQTIALDPRTGQLISSTFDEDGGHGEALWFRDQNRWVMDSVGVLPDGTETLALNVLTRVNDNEILWRSVARVVGGDPLPDTQPIKIVRGQPVGAPRKGGN